MKVKVFPQEALVTEKINVEVSDLKAASKIKITLNMELPWCKKVKYSSYAVFAADTNGRINLNEQCPLEGTYSEKDSMGLIYSLERCASSNGNIEENISIDEPIIMQMIIENESEKKEIVLKRFFKDDDFCIENIDEKDFKGRLFYKKDNDKTILMLNGSSGNMKALELVAAPFAMKGINVLMIPYFAAEGLPQNLSKVPLEYFESVFAWMKNNEIIKCKDIYVYGMSKGAECSLLLASKYDFIKKVVAVEANAYAFQSPESMVTGSNESSWSYKGEEVPFIKLYDDIFAEDRKECIDKGVPFGFANTYRKSMELAHNKEEARIKLENSKADILLISGKKDNIWNSYEGCQEIMAELKKYDYKYKSELMEFDNMGHPPLPLPYILPISETLSMDMMGGKFTSGGTIAGNVEAQYKSWIRTLQFLKED